MHKLVVILLILLSMSCWRQIQNQIVPRVMRLSRVHINSRTEFGQIALPVFDMPCSQGSKRAPQQHMFLDESIDDCAKDGGRGRSDIYVVFTRIRCGLNFCVW